MPQQRLASHTNRVVSLNPRSHLQRVADQLNLAIAVWDLHRMQARFSSGLERLYGFAPEEFQGDYAEFLSYVHSTDRNHIQSVIQIAAESGQSFEVDYRIINKAGKVVWFASKGQVFISDRKTPELVEVIYDVTPRYQARMALAESHAQWNALLEKSDELLLQIDDEACISWVSPSSSHILGYIPELLLGESIFDLVHAADVYKLQRAFASLQQCRIPQTFQHSLRQPSASYLPVQSTLRLGTEVGSFAVLSCREIRARLNLQAVLESTSAAYAAIVDSTSDLIYRFLPDGTLTFTNRAFSDCFGGSTETSLGTNIYDLLLEDDRERFQKSHTALTLEHPSHVDEYSVRTLKGIQRQMCRSQALFSNENMLLEYQIVAQILEDMA